MIKRYLYKLPIGILVLWCYIIWYVVMVSYYFNLDATLWRNSAGLSLIVGVALVLATGPLSIERVKKHFWQVFRLFVCPFCVSSFSALTQGNNFLLFLSPRFEENIIAISLCLLFCIVTYSIKRKSTSGAYEQNIKLI